MTLSHIYRKEVLIDGVWRAQPSGAVNQVFTRLGIATPITTKSNYGSPDFNGDRLRKSGNLLYGKQLIISLPSRRSFGTIRLVLHV